MEDEMGNGKPKMRHCFYCGEELGVSGYHHPLDTCGNPECDRAARAEDQAQREEAHEELDRLMDW